MADDQTQSGGAAGDSGGAGAQGQADSANQSTQGDKTPPRVVSWDSHKRALDDMHKFKSAVATLEAKIGEIESDKLKQANDFKTLYEREKADKEALNQKYQQTLQGTVNTHRFSEIRAEAMKAGLVDTAVSDLELLDLSDVEVEATSSGRFIVSGAKEKVERIKSERPHWFRKMGAPSVNGGGGGVATVTKTTADDVYLAEQQMKRGQITKAKYQEVYAKHCKDFPLR
jgi:hypothetical protein